MLIWAVSHWFNALCLSLHVDYNVSQRSLSDRSCQINGFVLWTCCSNIVSLCLPLPVIETHTHARTHTHTHTHSLHFGLVAVVSSRCSRGNLRPQLFVQCICCHSVLIGYQVNRGLETGPAVCVVCHHGRAQGERIQGQGRSTFIFVRVQPRGPTLEGVRHFQF